VRKQPSHCNNIITHVPAPAPFLERVTHDRVLIKCPETSVTNYQSPTRNIPEECIPHSKRVIRLTGTVTFQNGHRVPDNQLKKKNSTHTDTNCWMGPIFAVTTPTSTVTWSKSPATAPSDVTVGTKHAPPVSARRGTNFRLLVRSFTLP